LKLIMAKLINPLKILQLTEASSAGVGLHVITLTQWLVAAGHEVHLIYSARRIDQVFKEGLARIPGLHGVPLAMHRNPHPADILSVKFIRRYVQSHGPFDILHGHSSKGGALLRLAGIGLPGAKIYTPNALITQDPKLSRRKRITYGWAEKILGKFTDALIAVSEEDADEARRLGIDSRKIAFIPNGIEAPILPERQAARARLKLTEDEVVIGFVGRLFPQKGPDIIIQAMANLVERFKGPEITLVMVGDGDLRRELQEMARSLEINARVRWIGEVPGVMQMPAFDILALPSLYEGMPYVLIEALFAGLPIVAAQVGGAKLLVEPGVNGYLVSPGDPQSLAQALGELIIDPAKRSKFGKASLKKSQFFTVDNMASRIQSLYFGFNGAGKRT
jgi:glycosyltransferase involved in cell wall biosynthesis